MKRSDVPTQYVINLIDRWWYSKHLHYWDAMTNDGIPPKVALRKVEQMNAQGYLNYGVSVNYCWVDRSSPLYPGDPEPEKRWRP